jgi:signal transduction histidine kinase
MTVSTLQLLIYAALFAGLPTALGLLMVARRKLAAQLESLIASQAREQQLTAEAVLAAERTRLAREMHDVVSHQVSLIALQSGALRMAAADDETRQTAGTIRLLAVKTLEELRAMVGVLRSRPEEPRLAPQPRLSELPRLVEDSATGAELVLAGVDAREWPPRVERAVYRTVQEGLTNIRKHASGAAARVEVSVRGATLTVRVSNGPPPGPRSGDGQAGLPVSGHGLVGLRERAALLGGQLTAAPTADGGFELRATFNAADPAAGLDSRDQDWTQITR